MKTDIFHLQIIPVKNILPHEEFDQSRAIPLIENLKKNKVLVNPIIVASTQGSKYIQLDGMNRYSAFRKLGLESILVQIIDYNDQESVELSSWSHLFAGEKSKFLSFLSNIRGLSVKDGDMDDVGHRYIKEEGTGRLCTVCTRDGLVYLISADGGLTQKIDYLKHIVSYYCNEIKRDLLPNHPNKTDIDLLFSEHQHEKVMIIFPTFTRHQIVEVVEGKKLFPAGVTRHIIKRRCLNINFPIRFFSPELSIEDQNRKLEMHISQKSFRIYEEPTVYFD